MAKYGEPLGLDAELKVDLIVVGSVAVCPKTGARLGKGEGFAELEYGILRMMGAVSDKTLIVTSVHDCQVLEGGEIDTKQLLLHDVPVDVICTPTRVRCSGAEVARPGPACLARELGRQHNLASAVDTPTPQANNAGC